MPGQELGVEQAPAAPLQPGDQMHEGDFRCVALAAEHAFAEEGATERDTVQAAYQGFVAPAFDAVGLAAGVQLDVEPAYRGVDPAVFPARAGGGAGVEDGVEGGVDPDRDAVSADRALQAGRDVEPVQRDDAALLRLYEEYPRIVAGLAHGEDAGGIAVQQFVGTEATEGPAGAETGVAQASPFWRLAQFSSQ